MKQNLHITAEGEEKLDLLLGQYHYRGKVDVVDAVMEQVGKRPLLASPVQRHNKWMRYAAALLLLVGSITFVRLRYVQNLQSDRELAQMMVSVYDFQEDYESMSEATYMQYSL